MTVRDDDAAAGETLYVEAFGRRVRASDVFLIRDDLTLYGCTFVDEDGRRLPPVEMRVEQDAHGRTVYTRGFRQDGEVLGRRIER